MSNLRDATEDEIKDEMERRKLEALIPAPQPIKPNECNWSPVFVVCLDYMRDLERQGWADDDYEHYIYESAIEAVFGKDVWKYINSRKG